MTIAAIGAAGMSLAPAGKGKQKANPSYGLAYRFRVEIDQCDLGNWQSCSGLKVEYKPAEIPHGGQYLHAKYMAGSFTYPKIVLKRAVSKDGSKKLHQWLKCAARDWVAGTCTAANNAKITMYDAYDNEVLVWKLASARPASWSGPDLDATSSKLAIETLELVHEGFEVGPSGVNYPDVSMKEKRLVLTPKEGSSPKVEFPFPPSSMKLSRTQDAGYVLPTHETATDNLPAGDKEEKPQGGAHPARSDVTEYSFSGLVLDGADTLRQIRVLSLWASKAKADEKSQATLPPLKVQWGKGLDAVVFLHRLTVDCKRFDGEGVPIRADVTLTLQLDPTAPPQPPAPPGPKPGMTSRPCKTSSGASNPTSGGIAGRDSHRLLAGENLQALAREHYGSPARWRAIADVNGIDDPLRLRPGSRLYLPARSEVTA